MTTPARGQRQVLFQDVKFEKIFSNFQKFHRPMVPFQTLWLWFDLFNQFLSIFKPEIFNFICFWTDFYRFRTKKLPILIHFWPKMTVIPLFSTKTWGKQRSGTESKKKWKAVGLTWIWNNVTFQIPNRLKSNILYIISFKTAKGTTDYVTIDF